MELQISYSITNTNLNHTGVYIYAKGKIMIHLSLDYKDDTACSGQGEYLRYVIIDCMPSLGMITINALAASDSVIVPVQAQYLPAKGMTQLMKTIGKVKKLNPSLKVDGILLTLADMRTNLARLTAETIRRQYGGVLKIFKTQIPVAVKAAETSTTGKSIFAYDKGSKVAQAYADFTKEVLADGAKTKSKSAVR